MANIEAKHLLRNKRFNENEWKFLTLICYFPFGLILCLLRSVLALSVFLLGYVLPDTPFAHKVINKITCLSLGITVSIENSEKKENVDIYVSNSVSLFDNLAVHLATGSISMGSKLPPLMAKSLGIFDLGNPSELENFKKKIQEKCKDNTPLHFAPEGKSTNGKALIKFETYPFSLANKVQPVCVYVERPFLDISVNNLGSSKSSDIFYYMFSPLTSYKLKFLAVLEKKNLSDEVFADIVRQNLASALNVDTVDLTAHDLSEWEKRQLVERKQARQTRQRHIQIPESRFLMMALQVKDVLPHVPLDAIYLDLGKTGSVDNTITNILEGRVQFIPETPASSENQNISSSVKSKTSSNIPSTSTSVMNTAASSFSKSAQERNKSFQERKEQLIANARKRYIEKHNLNIPV